MTPPKRSKHYSNSAVWSTVRAYARQATTSASAWSAAGRAATTARPAPPTPPSCTTARPYSSTTRQEGCTTTSTTPSFYWGHCMSMISACLGSLSSSSPPISSRSTSIIRWSRRWEEATWSIWWEPTLRIWGSRKATIEPIDYCIGVLNAYYIVFKECRGVVYDDDWLRVVGVSVFVYHWIEVGQGGLNMQYWCYLIIYNRYLSNHRITISVQPLIHRPINPALPLDTYQCYSTASPRPGVPKGSSKPRMP